jgi:hypothetical protein
VPIAGRIREERIAGDFSLAGLPPVILRVLRVLVDKTLSRFQNAGSVLAGMHDLSREGDSVGAMLYVRDMPGERYEYLTERATEEGRSIGQDKV